MTSFQRLDPPRLNAPPAPLQVAASPAPRSPRCCKPWQPLEARRTAAVRPPQAFAVPVPAGLVAEPPALAPTPSAPNTGELLKLLDVQRPYLSLAALRVGPGCAWARFGRESRIHSEVATPMNAGEISRHAANLGEVACVAANPVRMPHMYLALKATYAMAHDPRDFQMDMGGGDIEVEARVVRFARGMAVTETDIYIPGSHASQERELYAMAKMTYAVLPKAMYLKEFQDYVLSPTDQLKAATSLVLKEAMGGKKSPYWDPIYFHDVAVPAENTRSAVFTFDDPAWVAGHFAELPAMPASSLIGNAMRLIAIGFSGAGGAPLRLTLQRATFRFSSMPMLGERLQVVAERRSDTDFLCTVCNADTGACLQSYDLAVAIYG